MSGHEFLRRFLQHVLPKGLHKVRYYGLWHPARREQAARARQMLQLDQLAASCSALSSAEAAEHAADEAPGNAATEPARLCPCCKLGHLVLVGRLYPKQASGP